MCLCYVSRYLQFSYKWGYAFWFKLYNLCCTKMQLNLVHGAHWFARDLSHVEKHENESALTCTNITRVTENRFFVPLGFGENLVVITLAVLAIAIDGIWIHKPVSQTIQMIVVMSTDNPKSTQHFFFFVQVTRTWSFEERRFYCVHRVHVHMSEEQTHFTGSRRYITPPLNPPLAWCRRLIVAAALIHQKGSI